jgi:hypothetical protein
MAQNESNPVLLLLAVIGAVALVAILASWLFHASMMSGGMMGGMRAGNRLFGILVLAGVVAAIVLFARRGRSA